MCWRLKTEDSCSIIHSLYSGIEKKKKKKHAAFCPYLSGDLHLIRHPGFSGQRSTLALTLKFSRRGPGIIERLFSLLCIFSGLPTASCTVTHAPYVRHLSAEGGVHSSLDRTFNIYRWRKWMTPTWMRMLNVQLSKHKNCINRWNGCRSVLIIDRTKEKKDRE